MYVDIRSSVEIQNPVRWNLMGHGMALPPYVIAQECSSSTFVSLRFHFH
jgi:hypothetical protein